MAAKKPTTGKKLKEELLRLATELKTARDKEFREAIYSELIGIIHRL